MTQVFRADGQVVPVTVLKAGPCVVVQRKTPAIDGYDAVQLGLMEYVKKSRINKPETGHLKKSSAEGVKFLREFRMGDGSNGDLKPGDRVLADEFKPNEKVDVIGISKGRGFAGVVKRHHFRGSDATHGSMFHRAPGSIGASSFPSRVFPGMRMGGHMGTDRVTVRNLEIVQVDVEDNVILVKGAVPGPNGGYVVRAEVETIAMPSVDIIDLSNNKVGTVDLSDAVFAAPVNEALLYEAVRHHLAGTRRGTAKTKTRHEVAGSGKKLWKQKGTGRARMGSIRSPLWRHGGTTHGPQPRDYSYKLPKKMQLGALRSALSAKLRDGELRIVSEFALSEAKTKLMRKTLDALEIARTVLLVDNTENRNLELSSRNLEGVKLVASRDVNVYDLLGHQQVLLTEAAAQKLSEGLQ